MLGFSLIFVVLLMTFVARHSPVVGSSMYPTLIGMPTASSSPMQTKTSGYDVLLISDLFFTPETGDIIIVQLPSQTEEPLVKRVIATGGQTIEINFQKWQVWVDGELLDEPYINYIEGVSMATGSLSVTDGIWKGTVPEGYIFVMGDNRNNSLDSRSLGYIDERCIVGKVVTRLSPLDRFGSVE